MTQKFVNNYSTVTTQTLGIADTTLHVESVANLPTLGAGEFLLLTLFKRVGVVESGHEVVRVSAITGKALTISRSFEGAAPVVMGAGALVEARMTAKSVSAKADKTALDAVVADQATKQAKLVNQTNIKSVNGESLLGAGDVVLTKASIGLDNVNNTADIAKPVSTAQQSALNLKANLASPSFTGTPTGITKNHVGLGNVDNTADANKPISTATQAALNFKIGEAPVDGKNYVRKSSAWELLEDKKAILSLNYENRGTLRNIEDTFALVRGLGLFEYVEGSTELDDDESCFTTATGCWLLECPHWDFIAAQTAAEISTNDALVDSLATRWSGHFLYGTALCTILSVAPQSSAAFTSTVEGASVGDRVIATPPARLQEGSSYVGLMGFYAWVSSANTVTILLTNAHPANNLQTSEAIRVDWNVAVIKS